MNELSAALGTVQLKRLDSILEKRTSIANHYSERLAEIDNISTLGPVPNGTRSWFVYIIMLKDPSRRDALCTHLSAAGIDNRIYFPPLHLFPHILEYGRFREGQFPVTERVAKSTLALPFYTTMKDEEVDHVCDKVAAFFS